MRLETSGLKASVQLGIALWTICNIKHIAYVFMPHVEKLSVNVLMQRKLYSYLLLD